MSTMRLVGGVIAALVAFLAGGCGLLFTASGISDQLAGRPDYGTTMAGPVLGIVPGIVAGLIAWRLLRKKPDAS